MALASLKDLYLEELGDLYAAETQMLHAFPRLIDAARAPELREVLNRHSEESRLHVERLHLIFTHWGERVPVSGRCPGMAGIVQEADERLNQQTTEDVRDAAIIGIAQRAEHYEIAAYGCARTYARRLGRADEARLLQETLDEEGRADHRLTELATAHINDDARAEPDFAPSSADARLRYIDRRQLDHSRLTADALRVRNAADEDLGTFDGLIITPSADPRYIVVDGRRLFTGRRYLLPVGEVTFDDRTKVLRVELPRDVAERYPEFDAEQFQEMDADALRGYEAKLMEFFRRDPGVYRPEGSGEPVPEWLLTGVWITVTPDRAANLSNAVRSFANELSPNSTSDERTENAAAATGDPAPVDVAGPADDVAGPNPNTVDNAPLETSGAERMVARVSDPEDASCEESITPPHGDKLRDKAR